MKIYQFATGDGSFVVFNGLGHQIGVFATKELAQTFIVEYLKGN